MEKTKLIRVLEMPATWIVVDLNADEDEARERFLLNHKTPRKPICRSQERRERVSVRQGRVYQRSRFKAI